MRPARIEFFRRCVIIMIRKFLVFLIWDFLSVFQKIAISANGGKFFITWIKAYPSEAGSSTC